MRPAEKHGLTIGKWSEWIAKRYEESRARTKDHDHHVVSCAVAVTGGVNNSDVLTPFPMGIVDDPVLLRNLTLNIATDIWECADTHVQGQQTTQNYEIILYTAEDEPYAKQPFSLLPPKSMLEGGMSEAPTSTGVAQMAMRFNDQTQRAYLIVTESTQNRLERVNDKLVEFVDSRETKLQAKIDKLEGEKDRLHARVEELILQREGLLDRKAEREDLAKAREQDKDLADRFFAQVQQLAPLFIQQLQGGSAEIVRRFFNSLTPAQQNKLFGEMDLTPEQMGMLKQAADSAKPKTLANGAP